LGIGFNDGFDADKDFQGRDCPAETAGEIFLIIGALGHSDDMLDGIFQIDPAVSVRIFGAELRKTRKNEPDNENCAYDKLEPFHKLSQITACLKVFRIINSFFVLNFYRKVKKLYLTAYLSQSPPRTQRKARGYIFSRQAAKFNTKTQHSFMTGPPHKTAVTLKSPQLGLFLQCIYRFGQADFTISVNIAAQRNTSRIHINQHLQGKDCISQINRGVIIDVSG